MSSLEGVHGDSTPGSARGGTTRPTRRPTRRDRGGRRVTAVGATRRVVVVVVGGGADAKDATRAVDAISTSTRATEA